MRVFYHQVVRDVLVPLQLHRVLNYFYGNGNHACYLCDDIFAHRFGSVRVPFVALSIFSDSRFSFVDDFSFIDRLFEHFVWVVLDLLGGGLDDFLLGFLDDVFIGS